MDCLPTTEREDDEEIIIRVNKCGMHQASINTPLRTCYHNKYIAAKMLAKVGKGKFFQSCPPTHLCMTKDKAPTRNFQNAELLPALIDCQGRSFNRF